jgi:hypothetical protein
MNSAFSTLIAKINEFIRKYYLNKLVRGSLYTAAFMLSFYVLLLVTVYFTYPPVAIKTTLFYSFVFASLLALGVWVIKPIWQYFQCEQAMSHQEAARLIGAYFPAVADRLTNTLQLETLAQNHPENNALIIASIDQKIKDMRPIPFNSAIRLGDNKKNLKFLLAPSLLIIFIALLSPAILRDGTYSFVRYNQEILPQAPFQFVLENKQLTLNQGDDFLLKVKLTGDRIPQDIYVAHGQNTYKLDRIDINHFNYLFQNVQKSMQIRLTGGGFSSSSYQVLVQARPALLAVRAGLNYPSYIQRKPEIIENSGDLIVPEGTNVTWQINTANAESITFILNGKTYPLPIAANLSSFKANIRHDAQFQISVGNRFTQNADTLSHQIRLLKDEYPLIRVDEARDSISQKSRYFSGQISDDYGFSSLNFVMQIKNGAQLVRSIRKSISIDKRQLESKFFFRWNFQNVALQAGQTIDYFFEVADNDAINGAKTSRSELKTYQEPNAQQLAEQMNAGTKSVKDKITSSIKLAKEIEKESKRLSENLLDKKQLNFEDKKQIEALLDKQQQLEKALSEIKKQNEQNNRQQEENQTLNDDIKEKQKQLENLFNQVLDEKTKELLNKLQKLMDQNRKDDTQQELGQVQTDNKTLKNELDRLLELYKQLEFEQNLQNKIDRLQDLAKQQKELAKQQNLSLTEQKNKQEKLNTDFKALQKELQELSDKNQALERPNAFENPEKESKEIAKNQAESSKQLEQNQRQKAADKQEQAGEQMQQMAQKLQEQQQDGAEMESKVNAQELRALLQKLLNSSFDQEKLMLGLKQTHSTDPKYLALTQQQKSIGNYMNVVADSLFSLSKRVPQIETTVSKEVESIKSNINKAVDYMADRRTAEANRSQQYTMTAMNNLALLLNEALEQLQNAMKNAKSGKGKPKQGMKQLQQMQEALNKNMKQAKQQMEQQGNAGKVGKGKMSEEFAKMAQQQQMLRNALEKINREDNKGGGGKLGNLNQAIDQMKQTELELVNKRISQETLRRQKDLMVKLLDAEKAEREQQEDEKRESQAAKQFPPSYQKMLEKFMQNQGSEEELLQKLPPKLNYYYKNKVAEYYKLLNLQRIKP